MILGHGFPLEIFSVRKPNIGNREEEKGNEPLS